ncbi:hypothetical protein CR513_41246, partial [Mucuna pruriens]
MNDMKTKSFQGPITRGRMRRLQEEVLKEIGLLMESQERTFHALKERLTNVPILELPNFNKGLNLSEMLLMYE